MNIYGTITFGAYQAPQLFTGEATRYSYRDMVSERFEEDARGENMAVIFDQRKAELSFAAKITNDSTDFLDLSSGAAMVVSGISGGVLLATTVEEDWNLGQAKTASVNAVHYPDIVQASPALAGTALDAFTPDQAGLGIVTPTGKIISGTYGLGHASGVLHQLTITQELKHNLAEPTPDGKIIGVQTTGYVRRIRARILATSTQAAVNSTLAITGAPSHAEDYKITSSEVQYELGRGKMYLINAVWTPLFSA